MRFQIQKQGGRRAAVQPEFKQVGDGVVIGSTQSVAEGGRRNERYQVISFRNGKIVDMQGFTSLPAAERFARRRRQT